MIVRFVEEYLKRSCRRIVYTLFYNKPLFSSECRLEIDSPENALLNGTVTAWKRLFYKQSRNAIIGR